MDNRGLGCFGSELEKGWSLVNMAMKFGSP
jgi:hypothetical protein